MAVFCVQGKLGTGKTKWCVWRAQGALREGRRVASNVDLYLDKLTPERASRFIRIPDKPTAFDLDAIGHGNPESYNEDNNGVLILDELATWLNSRAHSDKSRSGVIDWLVHARKLGWDVYLIVQDANMIDKQVREALVEYTCNCLRLDKVRIPWIGGLINDIGGIFKQKRWGYLPRFHTVTARVGDAAKVVAERWWYKGDDLHVAYDTRQVFVTRDQYAPDWFGAHTVLPAWGWAPPPSLWQKLRARWSRPAAGVRSAPRLGAKPKLDIIQSIERCLPPDERARHVRRLTSRGVI